MLNCRETGLLEKTKNEIKMGSRDLIILDVKIVSSLLEVEDSSVITWILGLRLDVYL